MANEFKSEQQNEIIFDSPLNKFEAENSDKIITHHVIDDFYSRADALSAICGWNC